MNDLNTHPKEFKWTKSVRLLNLFCAIIWGLSLVVSFESFRFLGAYFFAYFYLWFYLLFIIFEFRFIVLTKSNLLKHLTSNWIVLFGFFAPILIFFFYWGW